MVFQPVQQFFAGLSGWSRATELQLNLEIDLTSLAVDFINFR